MEQQPNFLSKYWPLLILLITVCLAALAITYSIGGNWHEWMHYFMGLFLTIFGLLKLFNPTGFADGFQMYDVIAKRSRRYALIYPYFELLLGLAYLAFILPILIYTLTIILMSIGAIGVIKALKKGLDVRCACMGTALNVPLSTVTLTEDLGMIVMSLVMLLTIGS
jgi:archaellum biogenesis protein FlaJ (TadC family)